MFEAYPIDSKNNEEFKKCHVIKVIPDDSVEVQVKEAEHVFIIIRMRESLQWETIDTREEIKNLLQRNKCHLQQVEKKTES